MKISELIDELKEYNPDAEITTPYSETIGLSFISEDGADKSNTELVFIELRDYVEEDD